MNNKEDIIKCFLEVAQKYPELMLRWQDDIAIIEGKLPVCASYNGIKIQDEYDIQIWVSTNFPKFNPVTREVGGRIPANFHKNGNDILCLEVESRIKLYLIDNPSLLAYIEKFVIEYLYGFSYREKYGELPYGERSHGSRGILEYYKEEFKVEDNRRTAKLLYFLATGHYKGHHSCVCGSSKKIRECHGPLLRKMMLLELRKDYIEDCKQVLEYLREAKEK